MIADTVEFIRTQLRGHLGAADRAVVAGPVPAPARGEAPPDVCLSLVSAEHDASARNAPRPAGRAEPPLALALLLLVSFPARDYGAALGHLSRVAALFHGTPAFGPERAAAGAAFPAGVASLAIDPVPAGIAELSALWAMMGGRHLPSLLYRARVVALPETAPGPVIVTRPVSRGKLR